MSNLRLDSKRPKAKIMLPKLHKKDTSTSLISDQCNSSRVSTASKSNSDNQSDDEFLFDTPTKVRISNY